ncbi:hypothetical protein WA538_005188, partial [Blastocystis sp. DL]
MTCNILSIIERLSYIRSCYTDHDCLVFESVRLSEKQIEGLFPGKKQNDLYLLMNIVSSLSAFPFHESPIARINFLQQLLYEVDYRSYPFAAQVLRESEFVDWNHLPSPDTLSSFITPPNLYALCDEIRYIHYTPRFSQSDLSPRVVASSACTTLQTILNVLQDDRSVLSEDTLAVQDQVVLSLV